MTSATTVSCNVDRAEAPQDLVSGLGPSDVADVFFPKRSAPELWRNLVNGDYVEFTEVESRGKPGKFVALDVQLIQ